MRSPVQRLLLVLFVSTLMLPLWASAIDLPNNTFPNTVGVQLKDGDVSSAQAFELIQNAGFKVIRKGVYWNRVEKTKGIYNFGSYQYLFDEAEKRNVWMIITLFSGNTLYENTGQGGITTDAGRRGFADFAAAAARHLKGRRVVFEIWNEPNLGSFWRGSSNTAEIADQYTALVKATVPKMLAADPEAFVVAGSVSALWKRSFEWLDRCIQMGILKTGVRGISVHPYGFAWPELSITQGYGTIRKKLDDAGASQLRIINSEVGYSIPWIVDRQGFTTAQAEEVQGWLLVRQQMVDQMSGIGLSNWYEFKDDLKWGIVDKSYNPKKAYYAGVVLKEQLTGYRLVKKLTTTSALDYVLLFQNSTGHQKIVAWTTSSAADSIDRRQPRPHEIQIGVSASGELDVVTTYGAKEKVYVTNKQIKILVEGAPKYISLGNSTTSPTEPDPETAFQLLLNSGGPAFVTSGGRKYSADRYSSGGRTFTKNIAIAGTVDDAIYQTERYGNFAYNIPVSRGTYLVTLDFAETYFKAAGKRVFDVKAEGRTKVSGLDIFAASGAYAKAHQSSFKIDVLDGTLNLNFISRINNAKVNGITIIKQTSTTGL